MLDQDIVKSLIDYDPDTGICRWKARDPDMFQGCKNISPEACCRNWNNLWAGREITSIHPSGYIRVSIGGNRYLLHRVIYLIINGRWPDQEIDHADGDRKNNRADNLRSATSSENHYNQKKRSDNSTGYKGVSRFRDKYQAGITINKKRVYLGIFDTPEKAHKAYTLAANKIAGQFARAS